MANFLNLKINEMFDVIIYLNEAEEYQQPPCIVEFKQILQKVKVTGKLASEMKNQIIERLLLPGINTKLIINFYIQLIRVFKYLDPSTILLEIVSQPI